MKFKVSFLSVIRFISLVFMTCMVFSASVMAESAGDLAKSANKSIRNAERAMYERKIDQSVKLLEEARVTLDALKTSDSNFAQLKSLEIKYERTKKMVDKKLGSTQVNQSASSSSPPPSTKISSGEKLPSGVSKRLRDIIREFTSCSTVVGKKFLILPLRANNLGQKHQFCRQST